MSGLRFDSMADMPAGMRNLCTKQTLQSVAAQTAPPTEPEKRPKYNNQQDLRGKIHFDSRKEARRYDELLLMLRAGKISDLRLQPQFTLQESYKTETGERIRAVRYTADFSYKNAAGELAVEDVKSGPTRTKEYLRNKKMIRSKYGIDIQEV